jgi:glyoxylase I family protein
MKTTGLHHICIRVQDQAVSRRWYEDVLGFECVELPPSKDQIATWRGQPASGTVVMMRAGDTYITLQPPLEGTAPDDRFSEYRIGVDHLAFAVEDRDELDSLVDSLRAGGVPTEGVTTHPVLQKEFVVFRDPDNVQWEAFMM